MNQNDPVNCKSCQKLFWVDANGLCRVRQLFWLPISRAVDNSGNPDIIIFNPVHNTIKPIKNFPAGLISNFGYDTP